VNTLLGKPAFVRVFSLTAGKEPGHPVFIYDDSANYEDR
jgi:hypothetical protein